MEQTPTDLRKKIVRYRRSRAVMSDPDTINMIDRIIKDIEAQIETSESRGVHR
jgi:hypothetical protein